MTLVALYKVAWLYHYGGNVRESLSPNPKGPTNSIDHRTDGSKDPFEGVQLPKQRQQQQTAPSNNPDRSEGNGNKNGG
jgi:hypothetical protein